MSHPSSSPIPPSILILGTADWNQPIATNQHYATREICRYEAESICFVESMGLRQPDLSYRDLRRMAQRVRTALSGNHATPTASRSLPEGLHLRSPLVLPKHSGISALINRPLVQRLAAEWSSFSPKVLWTYTPVTYGLEQIADRVIYHCVDLLGTVPGIDSAVIHKAETELASIRATAVATSQTVQTHLRQMGFNDPLLWENVADVDVIKNAVDSKRPTRKPGIAFFSGNLSPSKIDYKLLITLAEAGLDVRVAGPRTEGGGNDAHEYAALESAGVKHLGMLTLPELAIEMATATVGLIPYQINAYTRGVSPLKTFEYLAAGLPVVSTNLPGVHREDGDVWVETTPQRFTTRVLELSQAPASPSEVSRRKKLAGRHSWTARGQQIRNLLALTLGATASSPE